MWRSGLSENPRETTQAIDDIVWECRDDSKDGNGTDRRLHGGTEVNLVTALGFYSMFGSLESLLNLEQKHEMVTAISVDVFPGVLQTVLHLHSHQCRCIPRSSGRNT